MKDKWTKRFIELTKQIAQWSKDKSVKTGAVIVNKENRIISTGYNGFPSGCNDYLEDRYERPNKYLYTEHAERNAIYNAAKNGIKIEGCFIYLTWFPCADCARAIIQGGIKKIICKKPDLNDKKWGDHFIAAIEMLGETSVEIEYYEDK